ncbi:flagellar hook assembly protein FlgD [Neorhizobium sp. CSC1952]|uniref:Basal-body rod modification protein FlgD n=1 Tax=Xaviernesmea oryzae TaxID=464029 RepID=A0A1X7F0L9_9HYPH|nr:MULTISPECIES: flagellar hook assembly protein FlgD [Rhizobium/Agrobacterium group]WJR68074.1 flagellar hook assembly protein FlgD [Rhizobium sp. CSC1952]SMF43695.1 flagellar basal-body rod modification protein FlgD [Xaviernesmea oryzae]
MAIDPISSATANPWANAGASTDAAKNASLNYNNFLRLLIEQMKHQDPTDPMDATEQISQLATFSQVEQSIQTNNHLKSMLQAEALTRATDLVGKYIKSADDTLTGKVKEVEVYADGVVAITENNDKILLQAGVVFSDQPLSTGDDDASDGSTEGDNSGTDT